MGWNRKRVGALVAALFTAGAVGVVAGAAGVVANPTLVCGSSPGFCPNPPGPGLDPHPERTPGLGCAECGRF